MHDEFTASYRLTIYANYCKIAVQPHEELLRLHYRNRLMATETVTTGPSMPVASLAGPSSSTAFAFAALMGCAASPNQVQI